MPSIAETRTAIAEALESIEGLHVYKIWPNEIVTPALLVEEAKGIYDVVYEGGLDAAFGLVLLVSGLNSPGGGMLLMDAYLEPKGDDSIYQALRAGGFGLASFENVGKYDVNGAAYYGVHLTTGEVLL